MVQLFVGRQYCIVELHGMGGPQGAGVQSTREKTMDVFWRHLCWSLHWLMQGLWPDVDPDGAAFPIGSDNWQKQRTPLADGWYAVLWLLKGDLEYFALTLGLEHYGASSPCFLCSANSSDAPWTECKPTAKWMSRMWGRHNWRLDVTTRNPIFHVEGISITSVAPDVMHSKHLGTDAWFYGSVLQLMVKDILSGTAETNLEQVWAEIKEQYRIQRTTTQFSSMKATMFSGGTGFPKLKGKASEKRHIGKPLKVVFDAHMDSANQQHRMVSLALKFSIWIEDILDANTGNITLPAEDHTRLVEATYAFLNLTVSLGNYYHPRGVLLFNYTIKFHYLLHIAIGSKRYNPRWAWCYSGEAFMQVMKKVVASCQSGTKAHLIGRKVLRKYADGLSFSLLGDEWWH